jgi:hypothetical protein
MGYPYSFTYPTATVAQNASESAAISLQGQVIAGFVVPSTLEATTAQMSFKAATTAGGTYKVVKVNGTKLTLAIAVDDFALLNALTDLYGMMFVKIVLETSGGVAVSQATADRVFEIITADMR